jgi:CDP-diacylglycerol--glycerol-3-phosphate 3-phosphatidyltransferase
MKETLPWAMVWLRVALCPVIVLGARHGWDGKWLGFIVLAALVDDIYDGVLARRWGCATERLRRADSTADTVFYLGVAAALWLRQEQLLRVNWKLLALLGVLELLRYGFDWLKFGKTASYHSYLAKAWGLVMGAAVIGVLSFGGPRWLVSVSLMIGIASDVEGLAMSLMLPRWRNDVKTLAFAWKLRGEMLEQRQEESGPIR